MEPHSAWTEELEGRECNAPGLTVRSLVVACLLSLAAILWVREIELVALRCLVTESAPPITAVASLLLLGGAAAVLRRRKRWTKLALTRQETLTVFVFVSVASVMSSVGVVRLLLPALTVPRYFATQENHFARIASNFPPWWAPSDEAVLVGMYEGSDRPRPDLEGPPIPVVGPIVGYVRGHVAATAGVPWRAWAAPLLAWSGFLIAYFVGSLCVLSLLRRQWCERERLVFPLSDLPILMLQGGGGRPFWRDRVMWLGFGLAAIHNVLNMLHAFYPSVPALGTFFPLGATFFTEHPWTALAGNNVWFRPATFGLAYFVPVEILRTSSVFYILAQAQKVGSAVYGIQEPGTPFLSEQAMGGYLALGLFLLWAARRSIAEGFRAAFGRAAAREAETDGGLSPRLAVWGSFVSAAYILGMMLAAGLPLAPALAYFVVGALVMIVYARVRGETGVPNVWLFPFMGQRNLLLNLAGSEALRGGENYRGASVFTSLFFLSRGFATAVPAAELEGVVIAGRAGIREKDMTRAIVLAVVVGLALAFWLHLSTYYDLGANVLEGGSSEGGFRTFLARTEFQRLSDQMNVPEAPNRWKMGATLLGGVVTIVLIVLRTTLPRFPLHPLGFALPLTLEDSLWASLLLMWVVKSSVLRVGGVAVYRRLAPCFAGMALGHFFVAGVVWGVISVIGGESTAGYQVWFG